MLRISTVTGPDGSPVVWIEGTITEDELELLDDVCRERLDTSRRLVLDLSEVTYIDEDARRYLCSLRDRGADIASGSPFINELLKRERS
jgi:anti-anti-sigma regulatory factor